MHRKYRETVDKLRTWSQRESSVHSTLILGSQARTELEGDEWSDLDVLLLVDDPHPFLRTNAWLAFLGEILCEVVEETSLDWIHLTWTVKRVLFADNRVVDFSILPYDRVDDVLSLIAEIHAQGYEIIHDDHAGLLPSKIEATLANVTEVPPRIPTEDELRQTVDDLLFQLIFACKKIKREELWVAVSCINQQISRRLLDLIEYRVASVTKTSQRICHDGRFLEKRIHPDTHERLANCFAKYDVACAIQTASHLLDTTHSLVKDICRENDYPFDDYPFDGIRKLYREMFENEHP